MVERGLKKGLKSGGGLSNSEREVLQLFSENHTIKQIARRRDTTIQAVYKIRKKLINLGFLSRLNKVENFKPTFKPSFKPSPHPIRLHGQEFNIQLLFRGSRFKSGLLLDVDGNRVRTYNNSVEVYSGHSFYADSVQKATVRSLEYFNRLFVRLENDLDIIIIKPRSQNIRVVNAHYAEVNNELARESEVRGDRIRVYARDDGKLWFTIDRSLSCEEAETLHPATSKTDMQEVVRPFFNDLRSNRPPSLSEIMRVIGEVVKTNKETASGLNCVANVLKRLYDGEEEHLSDERNAKLCNYFG